MSNQINPAFITTKHVSLVTESGVEELDLLVVDKKANDQYFKKLGSFDETVAQLPEDVKGGWEMSKSFMDTAVSDIITAEYNQVQEAFIANGQEPPEFEPTVLGYPIFFTNEEEPKCIFHSEAGPVINDFWKWLPLFF